MCQDSLPYNDYFEYFAPDYKLHLPVSNMENKNSPKQLEDIKLQVFKILDNVEAAPGTQIFTGQTGTTWIPDEMDVVTCNPGHKGVMDSSSLEWII